jgi:peptidoglycan-N-acetylglucosamine deacetylase
MPIALVAGSSSGAGTEAGFDATAAASRVTQGAADRLRARGVAVQSGQNGRFVVLPSSDYSAGSSVRGSAGQGLPLGSSVLTLSVAFSGGAGRQDSGAETRFGGSGDEAWRLAARVQPHLVGGLGDVLDYHSSDRGVFEEDSGGAMPGRPDGLQADDPWVVACPLLATNPTERAMLESQAVLDLLSEALADAVSDYLNPGMPTPPRDPRYGWRQFAPWQPVAPSLVVQAEHSTRVALTFDAGSYPPFQPAILDELRDAGVRCTMFLVGDFVDEHPDAVVQMVKDGHEIGNHSDTHPDMPSLSSAEMVSELEGMDAKVVALTGKSTRPWFRPPSGSYDDHVVQVAADQGYHTIYWTADSADWQPDADAATVEQRLLRYATPGSILVEHLTSPQSAEVLPEVLRILKARGVEFATISEMLGTAY